jgi:TctA family transporter
MMEENLSRAMLMSRGNASVFITEPISGVLLGIAALLLLVTLAPVVRKTRELAFQE